MLCPELVFNNVMHNPYKVHQNLYDDLMSFLLRTKIAVKSFLLKNSAVTMKQILYKIKRQLFPFPPVFSKAEGKIMNGFCY